MTVYAAAEDGSLVPQVPRPVGWLCPKMPEGPVIPLSALSDPCGGDRMVWSDGFIGSEHPAAQSADAETMENFHSSGSDQEGDRG